MPYNYLLKICYLVIAFIGLSVPVSAQRIENYLSKDSLSVGDAFEYTLVAKHKSAREKMILPDSSAFGDFIAIRNIQHYKLEPLGDSVVFSLSFFGTSDTLLPIESISIVEDNGDTVDYLIASAPLFFKSVLPDTTADFKPYKPLFTFTNLFWFIVALLLLAAAYGLWYYYRKIKSEDVVEVTTPEVFDTIAFVDPLKTLEKQLITLKRVAIEKVLADSDNYYIALSNAFRQYFETVYQFPALEQTSSEIIRKVRSLSFDQKFIGLVAKMLRDADLVKFARFEPTEELWTSHLQDAQWLIERFRLEDIGRIDALKTKHLEKEAMRKEEFEALQKQKMEPVKEEKPQELKNESSTESSRSDEDKEAIR